MSNFNCEHCGEAILEGADGRYVTGCQHYPLEPRPAEEKKCAHKWIRLGNDMTGILPAEQCKICGELREILKEEKPSEPQGWEISLIIPIGLQLVFRIEKMGVGKRLM